MYWEDLISISSHERGKDVRVFPGVEGVGGLEGDRGGSTTGKICMYEKGMWRYCWTVR